MRLLLLCRIHLLIVLSIALAGCTATMFTPTLRVPILMYHLYLLQPACASEQLF